MIARHVALRSLVVILMATVMAVAWNAGLFRLEETARLHAAIQRLKAIEFLPPFFVAGYAVLSAAGVPASPLTLAGGALFGAVWGTALNWMGAFGGSIIAFGATRLMAGARRGSAPPTMEKQEYALRTPRGPLVLFRLRLVPVVPFSMLNIGAALSGMRWPPYLWATGLGIIPVTVIHTVFAASLIAGVEHSGRRALITAVVAAAVITGVTLLPRILRRNSGAGPGGGHA